MPRRTYRQDVVTRLSASSAVTALVPSASIYDSRASIIPEGKLPAISVFAPRTARTAKSPGLPVFEVKHTIAIDCFATAASDAELSELLDEIAEAVVEALFTDPAWVAQFEHVDSVSEEVAIEVREARQGLCRITIDVTISEQYDPVDDGPLSTIVIDVDKVPTDGQIEASITIEVGE